MPRNANQSKSSNYSLDFNSSPYIDTNLNTGSYSSFSVSAWIKADTLSSGKVVAAQTRKGNWSHSSWLLYIEAPGGIPYMTFYMPPNVSTFAGKNTVLSTNQWYHIVATWDGATSKVYIDGVKETTEGTVSSMNATPINTLIGSSYDSAGTGTAGGWDGQINEVSIFDYALSPSQVTTLYGTGSAIGNPMALPSPPVAYYPLGTSAWNGEYLAENNAIGDYVFDFDSDYIKVNQGSGINISGNLTLSAWVYIEDDTWNPLISKSTDANNRNYEFAIRPTTRNISFYTNNGSYEQTNTSLAVSLNTWTHIVISCESGVTNGTKFYFNNALDTTTGTHTVTADTADLYLGTTAWNSFANYFNGQISNVQIFNTALSGPEVETLYNYGSPIRTLANIPQNSNLKAWYKLDASEVYNSSTTEWSIDNNQNPSAYSSSLDFDASSSDYIQIPYNVNLTPQNGNFTISAWINTDNLSGWHPIWCTQNLSSSSTPLVALHTFGDKVRATVGGSTNNPSYGGSWALLLDSTQSLTASTWYHIAVSYDMSGDAQIYINGNADNSGPIENPQTSWTTGDRFIGEGEGYWDGRISNLSIWNTALTDGTGGTPNQIAELYNNGTPSNLSSHSGTSNLVSWYKLNNTTTGIEDSKGSNNGTNNGATEYAGFVNTLVGTSSGMSQANLVQSDLQTVAPYSKYAMNFDAASVSYVNVGNDSSLNLTSQMSVSIWAKPTGTAQDVYGIIANFPGSGQKFTFEYYRASSGSSRTLRLRLNSSNNTLSGYLLTYADLSDDKWHHLAFTVDGTTNANGINVYVDGAKLGSFTAANPGIYSNSSNTIIGAYQTNSTWDFDGYLSNASIWDTALTESQITEIYNEGLPGNLNSHSAYSNLVSWWQLGENSSFDGNDWIVADEKGTNNGTSTGMPVSALVNGVGTTANGVSSGMSEGNLVGDAPYSTANAISSGMSVESRVTGSGNTP